MKASVFFDRDTELLIEHLRHKDEGMSRFVQRMIREAAEHRGLEVVTEVRVKPPRPWHESLTDDDIAVMREDSQPGSTGS